MTEPEFTPAPGDEMSETTEVVREVVFWSCDPDAEYLYATSVLEAVQAWADGHLPNPLPETIKVHGFARMEPPDAAYLARAALERVLEDLDEEHGNPDDATEPNEAMRAAALAFAEAVRSEYQVWSCEEVTSKVVRVADHLYADWFARAEGRATPAPQGANEE